MSIFTRCLRSLAAVTPAKYELDIIQVTTVLIIRKKWENNGTEKIGLVNPTTASLGDVMKFDITEQWKLKMEPGSCLNINMSLYQ